MNPNLYLGLGILTSFILLSTVHKPRQLEAFREQPVVPRRSHILDYTITPLSGEAISSNANGVVLDQGSQAVRVGTSNVMIYTNATERVRITNAGNMLISTLQEAAAINNNGQINPLNVGGSITLEGNALLSSASNSLSAYFSAMNGYYDMGGITIKDRSLESGSTTIILGEWIQYQLAYPLVITSYSLCPVQNLGHNGNQNIPSSFQLVASNDGILWTLMDTQLSPAFNGTPSYLTYTIQNTMLYSYYRIIFTKLNASSSTTYGPIVEFSAWTLFDGGNNYYPPVMTSNTQTFGSNTYTISSSVPSGHTFSYINGVIQTTASNLVGLTQNPIPGSISLTSYYIFSYPYTNDIYTTDGSRWNPSGKTYTISLLGSTPYNSAVLTKAIYQGSSPMECMRVIYGPNGPQVGIGSTIPSSTLSVNGTMNTLYSAFSAGTSLLSKSSTNNNSLSVNCGLSSGVGYSSIVFNSVDSTGIGTANSYDAGLYCTGGTSGTNGKGAFSIVAGSFTCQTNIASFPTSNVGIGTTSPVSLFHVHSGSAQISNGTNQSGNGGELDFNTADTVSYKPMSGIRGKWMSANSSTSENSGGIGFFTRPSNSTATSQAFVEAMTIYHNGNIGIGTTQPLYSFTINNTPCFALGSNGYYTGSDLLNCSRLWYSSGSGGFLDYTNSFQIRANNSTSTLTSYKINFTCLSTGNVGIGSTNPGQKTVGGTYSNGLDISYTGQIPNDLLRVSNLSSSANTSKEVGIQFVMTDSTGNQKTQARMVSSTSDSTGNVSAGQLDIYIKASDTQSDSIDVKKRASVTTTGMLVGNTTDITKLGLVVGNGKGSVNVGTAAYAQDWSLDANQGDSVIATNGSTNNNLMFQTGSGHSAIFINTSNNVGMGTTNPTANVEIYYPYSNSVSTNGQAGTSAYNYLYSHANDTINANTTISVFAPSALVTGGDVLTASSGGTRIYGASMLVEGGSLPYSGSQTSTYGSIKFFSGSGNTVDSKLPIVQIGNPAYNTSQTYTYFQSNSSAISTSGGTISSFAILAQGNVLVSSGYSFMAFSDQRIKKNIQPLTPEQSLTKIMQISPCSYEMRDTAQPGIKLGVIAQEIQQVIPEAIENQGSQYIANILTMVERVEGGDHTILYLSSAPSHQPSVGKWIRLLEKQGEKQEVQIVEKRSDNVWVVEGKIEQGEWIVYGTNEDNVLAVDKDMISMVAVSAIQGLYHKYQSLERRLEAIENKLK